MPRSLFTSMCRSLSGTTSRVIRRPMARGITMRAFVIAVLTVGSVGIVVGGPTLVSAHSGLSAASPGPGDTVGGRIDQIELLYGNLVTAIDGSVIAPDGTELEVEFVLESEVRATIELATPLDQPGEYAVRHEVLSIDGDTVFGAYLFTYDPDAPPPTLQFLPEDDGGIPPFVFVIGAVGLVVIAVLEWRLWKALRRRKAAAAAAASSSEPDDAGP